MFRVKVHCLLDNVAQLFHFRDRPSSYSSEKKVGSPSFMKIFPSRGQRCLRRGDSGRFTVHRPEQVKSLRVFTFHTLEYIQLFDCFYPLGNDIKAQVPSERNYRFTIAVLFLSNVRALMKEPSIFNPLMGK